MFVGHFAIGFGAKRWAPKTSVGTLMFAALLADLLVFVFVAVGIEHISIRRGITRVNALNPVAGETPLLKTFMGEDTPEMRAKFLATIPIGRFSTPEDLGNAACFLCSDEASMITGVAMEVDGGRCI